MTKKRKIVFPSALERALCFPLCDAKPRTVFSHALCNMSVAPICQGAGRKRNQRYWFKALWEHTLFMFRPYRHKTFSSSHPGTRFYWTQQLMVITGTGRRWHTKRRKHILWTQWDAKHEHISKQMEGIPGSLSFISFPLPVQACLQAFRLICFPRPPFRACVWHSDNNGEWREQVICSCV